MQETMAPAERERSLTAWPRRNSRLRSWRRSPAALFHGVLLLYIPVFLFVVLISYRHFWKWEGWDKLNDFGDQRIFVADDAALPSPGERRVVFFGDSFSYLWPQQDPAFFRHDWIARGVPGQTTKNMLLRFRQDVLDLHPHTVHLLCGVNDMLGNTGPTPLWQIEDNLMSMVELAQVHGVHVVLGLVPPAAPIALSEIDAYDAWLRAYAAHNGIPVIDYYQALNDGHGHIRSGWTVEGLHPNAQGFKAMEAAAAPVLAQVLAQPPLPDRSGQVATTGR